MPTIRRPSPSSSNIYVQVDTSNAVSSVSIGGGIGSGQQFVPLPMILGK